VENETETEKYFTNEITLCVQQVQVTSMQTFQVGRHQWNHECDTACPTWQLLAAFSFQDPVHNPSQGYAKSRPIHTISTKCQYQAAISNPT